MASSGSFNTATSHGRYLVFSWSISSQSVANNTTTISWSVKGAGNSGYVIVSELKVIINGSQVYYRDSSNHTECRIDTVMASGTTTISHNTDGSKTFSASVGAGIYEWAINCNGSGSWALTTIPRSSLLSLSASSVNVGSSITANISRASSSFTHDVEFYINDTYYQKYTGVGTSQSYTIPTSWYNAMSSSTNCTAYCRITTYNGSTKIGDQVKKSFTVNVPSSVKPTVGTIKLTPATINSKSILIKGKNKLTVSVSDCSAGAGSTIKSYAFSGPSISKTISSTSSSASTSVASVTDVGSFTNEETTLTYTVTVTDQRGRTASKTNTIKCYDYYSPSFGKIDIYRASSDGSANVSGTYIQCDYTEKYASVNSTNSVTVTAYYNDGNTIRTRTGSNGKILINLNGDTSTTYRVYLGIDDTYGGSNTSSAVSIFGQFRVFNITSDGTGFAIGKMAESNNLFECRWDAKFDGAASGPSGFSTSSDERVKKNIQDIDVDIVDSLRPIQYELIQSTDGKTHYGFIAQDVEKILYNNELNPETIGLLGHIINNGRQEYVLTYTEFIPLLTKKCQALQAETNMLKQEISELKDAIALLQK